MDFLGLGAATLLVLIFLVLKRFKMGKGSYDKEKRRIYNAYYREVVLGKGMGSLELAIQKKAAKLKAIQDNRDYQKKLRQKRGDFNSDLDDHVQYINPEIKFSKPVDVVCSTFGCPNHLTPRETLFGDKCIHCQQEKFNPQDLL